MNHPLCKGLHWCKGVQDLARRFKRKGSHRIAPSSPCRSVTCKQAAAVLAMPYIHTLGINFVAYTVLQSITHAQEMRVTVAVGTVTLKSLTLLH